MADRRQESRRHLTTGQRAYLAYQYQQRLTVGRGTRTDVQQPAPNLAQVSAREAAAKKAGVSLGSLGAMKSIVDSGSLSAPRPIRQYALVTLTGGVKGCHSEWWFRSQRFHPSLLLLSQPWPVP
jgi:hypothetical protein